MAKIRKNAKRKKYQFDRNRKRMGKKNDASLKCAVLKTWNIKKTSKSNLRRMGLVYDINKAMPINPSEEDGRIATKESDAVKELEAHVYAPRIKEFRIPKGQVEFLTYMIDKYGDDYKSMVRDKRNVVQHTWKQFRAKIKIFKAIPEQYNPFVESKILPPAESVEDSSKMDSV